MNNWAVLATSSEFALILSPPFLQVAELFTDNFDYQTRDDFVRGLLVNEEVRRGIVGDPLLSDPRGTLGFSLDLFSEWLGPFLCAVWSEVFPCQCSWLRMVGCILAHILSCGRRSR